MDFERNNFGISNSISKNINGPEVEPEYRGIQWSFGYIQYTPHCRNLFYSNSCDTKYS